MDWHLFLSLMSLGLSIAVYKRLSARQPHAPDDGRPQYLVDGQYWVPPNCELAIITGGGDIVRINTHDGVGVMYHGGDEDNAS